VSGAGLRRRDALGLLFVMPAARLAGQSASGPRREVLYYGGGTPPPAQMELRAGPLTMVFEPELAFLRYVSYGKTEIVRGLYAAVRDRNWGTVAPRVSELWLQRGEDDFKLTFMVVCHEGLIHFVWRGTLTGDRDGTVTFSFDGRAQSTFHRNRVGFCLLHSHDVAGKRVEVEKADGSVQNGFFPEEISPHQPFMNIRSITHTVMPEVEAEVRFAGEVFEMEDQRNWTDGSYKTYCTPLEIPFPVEVKTGTQIRQSVVLRLNGRPLPNLPAGGRSAITVRVDQGQVRPLPKLGLGMSSVAQALSLREQNRLRLLKPAHLRADLKLFDPGFAEVLARAATQAQGLNAGLELAIHLGPSPELELSELIRALQSRRPRVSHFLVFHRDEKSTTKRWMELARRQLAAFDPKTRLASGTDAYFTELNRARPPVDASDLVTYSINPQVHAFDNLSLIETLEMHAVTLDSARRFCGALPLAVSPVTLKPRFNPNATAAAETPRGELPDEVDARQSSLFAAGWTMGSLKYLAEGGAASVTFYETIGWRGVMETEQGSRLPAKFPSKPGTVFPLFHVLASIADFAGGEVVRCHSDAKLEVEAMALRAGPRRRLLVANLSPKPKVVRLVEHGLGASVRAKMLDEHSAPEAMESPERWRTTRGRQIETGGEPLQLALLPYAIAEVDGVA
jgi:D-apionolactonase